MKCGPGDRLAALTIMTNSPYVSTANTEQKSELLNREDMQRLAADGGTRYHERAALIAKAEGESK